MAIIIKPPVSGGGGGAVDSVNGETGVVVLTTDNINAGSNTDRQYWTSTLQTSLDAKATDSDLTTLEGRVDTVESDINTLDGRVDTAESDIASLEANRLYSNSYYVNDGITDIQTVHDDVSFGQGDVIFVSSGSYGGSTLSLTKSNFFIHPPAAGVGDICELAGGRGLTISGNDCTRIRIRSLQIEGNALIDGTQGRHLFKDVSFLGTTTITNGTANYLTFQDCEFAGAVTIASTVTATIYFNRCSFGGVAISSSLANPLQCILADCSGINASQTNLVGLVFAGRTAFANNTVSQYTSNSKYVYNLLTGATTSFSGSYSELRDLPTIPSAYTDEMARDAAGTALANGSHTGISFVNSDAQDRIDATVSLSSFDTDDLSEGATNKYFSDTLARGAFSAGTGISITSGSIASTITQYTNEDAQDQAASIFTGGIHTGISYSYVDGADRIDSTVSLSGFSIDALSDVDTSTTAPTDGQALAWQASSSKWIPQTISGGGGGSRIAITEKTTSFQITDPVDASVVQEHYAMNSASSTTFTLPTAAGNNGLSYIITRVGAGAVTVATVSSQTISGLSSLSITSQWSSVTVKSNGSNWIIF